MIRYDHRCSKFYPAASYTSWSLRRPIVTAARLTPSLLPTCALVIPPATIAAHRAHRSGPDSRGALAATSTAARYRASTTHVAPDDTPGEPFHALR